MQKQTPATQATSKPAKADNADKLAEQAQREATCGAARSIARTHYNGASLAVRTGVKARTLATFLAIVTIPRQCAASETERDASALHVAAKHCDADHTFDPTSYAADLGAISRLASLGYLAVRGERIALTASGQARAKAIAAKA